MSYQEALDYIYAQLPMYQRNGAAAYKMNLDSTVQLCKLLENPEKKFKSIHVAGTNGKGSVSHLLASVFQEAGYKTGLYTSPHLKDFRERVKINGEMIPKENVVEFIEAHRKEFEAISLSFFEWSVGLAFDYFANQKVDIAVIEVGMGGRLDSTNIILPELSVITNISLDHTQYLGNTIEKIAVEKAGIIKQNIPIVIGEKQSETTSVFQEKAKREEAPIVWADQEINVCPFETELKGTYQEKNKKTAFQALKIMQKNDWEISERNIANGFKNVIKNTGLLGRWQIINQNPFAICDTGHNVGGIRYVVESLEKLNAKKIHFVFGVVKDKELSGILKLLPKDAIYYFCKANIPRALDSNILKEQAKDYNLFGENYESVAAAYQAALSAAKQGEMVFVGGSTFVVAEALLN